MQEHKDMNTTTIYTQEIIRSEIMSNIDTMDLAELEESRNMIKLRRMLRETEIDEIILWAKCPAYMDEIHNITDEDIKDNNGRMVKHIIFEFTGMGEPHITKDLIEWNRILNRLNKSTRRLATIKEEYKNKSDEILAKARKIKEDENIDIIKDKYGGNNDKTRKKYVEEELSDLINERQELDFQVAEDNRRIVYLKELIRTKRMILQAQCEFKGVEE